MMQATEVKEEVISPCASICDSVFDRSEDDIRKLSCSSNESCMSSITSSNDSGLASDLQEGKKCITAERETHNLANLTVQNNLELFLSGGQKGKIQEIVDSVQRLSDTEKLLLYLKLPTREQEQSISLFNTKQEQTFAFQWIRSNLEECDGNVNLPKHEVYDQYRAHCESHGSKRFLSAPDFGKIVKCIFPNVKARRLGTRGNSKYCYNGLRKIVFKEIPEDAANDIQTSHQSSENNHGIHNIGDQAFSAACVLVCEWANKLLGRFFSTLIDLAKFLVGGSYVSTKSIAALTVMSVNQESIDKINQRFSLDTLVKSSTSDRNKHSRSNISTPSKTDRNKHSKSNISTPSKTVRGIVTQCTTSSQLQVVPTTPVKNHAKSANQTCDMKLEEYTIDVSTPVFLEDGITDPTTELHESILMKDVNLLLSDNKQKLPNFQKESNTEMSKLDESGGSQKPSSPNRSKKIPKKLPLSIAPSPRKNELPSLSPYRTPKKVGRPRSAKKSTITSPYPSQSLRTQQSPMMSPRHVQLHNNNMPPPSPANGVHMTPNRFDNWPMPSPQQSPLNILNTGLVSPSNNEIRNIFLNRQMTPLNQPINVQRCHSVPVPQNICNELYQPLTPQCNVSNLISPRSGTFKAKRNLSTFFEDNLQTNDILIQHSMLNQMQNRNIQNDLLKCQMNQNFQNIPSSVSDRLLYNNMEPNLLLNSAVNTPYLQQGKNSQALKNEQKNMERVNDFGQLLNDLPTPDELTGLPGGFGHVDSDELLQSLQSCENIWANEWSSSTLPVI